MRSVETFVSQITIWSSRRRRTRVSQIYVGPFFRRIYALLRLCPLHYVCPVNLEFQNTAITSVCLHLHSRSSQRKSDLTCNEGDDREDEHLFCNLKILHVLNLLNGHLLNSFLSNHYLPKSSFRIRVPGKTMTLILSAVFVNPRHWLIESMNSSRIRFEIFSRERSGKFHDFSDLR